MQEKLKILLATIEYPPTHGGVGRYYQGLVENWGEGGVQVVHQKLLWPLWPHWLRSFWTVSALVKKNQPQYLGVGQVLPLGYLALWLKYRRKIPFIVFTHGMDILKPLSSKWKNYWLKKILDESSFVVANSEFTKNQLLKMGLPDDKTIVVYPGVTSKVSVPERNREELKNKYDLKDKKIILSVGRLVKRKGFDKIIDILPKLLRRLPDLKYVIIGSGVEEVDLRQKIDSYKLNDRVLILPRIGDEELSFWYGLADVFAMPCEQLSSDVEGFGIVFLEAAEAAKPVIGGISGGAPEAIKHGYSGFLINPESSEELYQALLKILSDNDFARRLGLYGREWVNKNFNWNDQVKKLKERLCP